MVRIPCPRTKVRFPPKADSNPRACFRTIADIRDYARIVRDWRRILTIVKATLRNRVQVTRPSSNLKDRLMNRPTIPLLAVTVSVALIAPSNVAAALLQAQPKVQVVAPTDPNAPPVAVVEPPDPNAPRVAVVPPPQSGAPPAFAILPPKPGMPAVAVVPPATLRRAARACGHSAGSQYASGCRRAAARRRGPGRHSGGGERRRSAPGLLFERNDALRPEQKALHPLETPPFQPPGIAIRGRRDRSTDRQGHGWQTRTASIVTALHRRSWCTRKLGSDDRG